MVVASSPFDSKAMFEYVLDNADNGKCVVSLKVAREKKDFSYVGYCARSRSRFTQSIGIDDAEVEFKKRKAHHTKIGPERRYGCMPENLCVAQNENNPRGGKHQSLPWEGL